MHQPDLYASRTARPLHLQPGPSNAGHAAMGPTQGGMLAWPAQHHLSPAPEHQGHLQHGWASMPLHNHHRIGSPAAFPGQQHSRPSGPLEAERQTTPVASGSASGNIGSSAQGSDDWLFDALVATPHSSDAFLLDPADSFNPDDLFSIPSPPLAEADAIGATYPVPEAGQEHGEDMARPGFDTCAADSSGRLPSEQGPATPQHLQPPTAGLAGANRQASPPPGHAAPGLSAGAHRLIHAPHSKSMGRCAPQHTTPDSMAVGSMSNDCAPGSQGSAARNISSVTAPSSTLR